MMLTIIDSDQVEVWTLSVAFNGVRQYCARARDARTVCMSLYYALLKSQRRWTRYALSW